MLFKKSILFLSIVLILAQGQQLQGLEYIKYGHDGLKLLNDQLGQSKYAIFDLNSTNGESSFNINEVTYKVPISIQATAQSLRKETQCEGIYYTFSEFQKKYGESITFSAGLGISNFTIPLGINRQLDYFKQQMTQKDKAISVSQSRWAMYCLTTAPAFLMPLNPLFLQSLDSLNKLAKTPQNNTQQTMYNDIVSLFGTHYVNSVVLGGSAKIYTILDKNYLKTVSYQEIKTQISIDYSYQVFEFQYGYNSSDIAQKLDENFMKSKEDVIIFSPEVDFKQNPKAWETWESNVQKQPQPVSSSVSYISDLVYQYPEVQAHLRKTIDFYLKNSKLPSFDQIQDQKIEFKQKIQNKVLFV
ncbi:hypothetical protein ABPG72_016167 [Tetrahymena utriculariae]